jgi:ATP-binding cassette subfamily B protein AbcA/BmrA
MQEPIEPTEALEDSENVLIDDGVLSFEHLTLWDLERHII